MMFINMSGSQIALAIVTEKSTRVVEYLMINVRPMALIVGKIMASLTTVLIQFAAYGVSYLLSRGLGDDVRRQSGSRRGRADFRDIGGVGGS